METPATTLEANPPPPPHARTAEEAFCRALPHQDPIAAHTLLCEALARLFPNREPDERQLSTLLIFDRHAHQISNRLMVQYAEGGAQVRPLDRRLFISAQRLSRSFAQAYEHFVGHIEESADKSWSGSAGTVLVQLFRHRQVELLLRLFRYKKRNFEQWRQIHTIYRSAQARGLAKDCLPRSLAEDTSAPDQTLEHQYIQILLLGAMNTGQFSPRELLWASNWMGRWRSLLALQSADANGGECSERNGFVVDLRGTEGLKRFQAGESGDFAHLDTSPLMAAIDEYSAVLNAAPMAPDAPISSERDARNALLSRLRLVFAPNPVQIKRRGERKSVAFSVEAISGLPHIVQMLREEAQMNSQQVATSATQLEEITISPTRGHTRMSTSMLGGTGLAPFSVATMFGARPQAWQVKDLSDSGCRMRGQPTDLNGLIPGSLIAIRQSEKAQWTVAVVRRLRRLMVDHVEISVEHIGRKPRFVKMVTDHHPIPSISEAPNSSQKCFGALYLPASEEHPTMPIKTLLVPASAFNAGCPVTLLSSTASYVLRLNKPLEQQSDFVWTSFAVIDKAAATSQQMLATTATPH